jgi:hypothetical protein
LGNEENVKCMSEFLLKRMKGMYNTIPFVWYVSRYDIHVIRVKNMIWYVYLSEDEFTIHKHGQGTKMKKHFICTKILCNNII